MLSDQRNFFIDFRTAGGNSHFFCVYAGGTEDDHSSWNSVLRDLLSSYLRACTVPAQEEP